ncbi:MAG: hypothetical protein HOQ11_15500, partial [Gemmatimonadaceae bacterium]|nr:hypothetical protein [Gemmatimonadaceae bacterium]
MTASGASIAPAPERIVPLPGYEVTIGRGTLLRAGAIAAATARAHHYALVT